MGGGGGGISTRLNRSDMGKGFIIVFFVYFGILYSKVIHIIFHIEFILYNII